MDSRFDECWYEYEFIDHDGMLVWVTLQQPYDLAICTAKSREVSKPRD